VKIADRVHKYTNKLVVSFVDDTYKKVKRNFSASNFEHAVINKNLFVEMLLGEIKHYGLEIYTCAEPFEINPEFAKKNKCIDDELIQQLSNDLELQQFIKILRSKNCIKDKGQRKFCNCMVSKDIGRYNSCMYACTYCYAGNIKHLDSKPELFK
jgi:hypothetical protein